MITNLKPIVLLKELEISDQGEVGNSIITISQLLNEGIPVPNGFIISNYVFDKYIDLSALNNYFNKTSDLKSLDAAFLSSTFPETLKEEVRVAYTKISGFSDVSVNIRGVILDEKGGEVHTRVFVEYEIKGEEEIISSIKNLYREIVIDDLNKSHLFFSGKLKIVLLVEKTVQAEVSGILYSSDIITKDNDKVVIEALFGLPSAIGETVLIPDQYIVSKSNKVILEKQVVDQEFMYVRQPRGDNILQKVHISPAWQKRQKLDDKYIQLLTQIAIQIEQELREIVQISWSFESGKLWINFIDRAREIEYKKFDNHELQDISEKIMKSEIHDHKEMLTKLMDNNIGINKISDDKSTETMEKVAISEQLTQNESKEELVSKEIQMDKNTYSKNEPLLTAIYGIGESVEGNITFDAEHATKNDIIVLKGDEDIPSNMQVAGIVVEDASELLTQRLNEYFKVTTLTGVPLATKILKEGEKIEIDGSKKEIKEIVPYTKNDKLEVNFLRPDETKLPSSETTTENPEIKLNHDLIDEGNENDVFKDIKDSDELEIQKSDVQKQNDIVADLEIPATKSPNFIKVESDISEESVSGNLDVDKEVQVANDKVEIVRRKNVPEIPQEINHFEISSAKEAEKRVDNKDITKLLDLVNDEDVVPVAKKVATGLVEGIDKPDQYKIWGKSLEKMISASKDIEVKQASEAIEAVDIKEEKLEDSKEMSFDAEQKYISEVKATVKPDVHPMHEPFLPTATKVYITLIDETIDEGLENYDGVIFTSTLDIDGYLGLLSNVLDGSGDKPVLAICPPYEEEAFRQFITKIQDLRNEGSRNLSLILPDYRNKKEIVNYKQILSMEGLRRSSTFAVYANLSRTINVFRSAEITDSLVDGVYIDLFRLKMNMLGVEKLTASTKYVEGMKKLVEYIHQNISVSGNQIMDITGFENPKAVVSHVLDLGFWGVSCDQRMAESIKKAVSNAEKKRIFMK